MAIARLGSIVGAISGSVGSVTFTNARAGLTVGQRRRFASKESVRQMGRRGTIAIVGQAWRALDEEQRMAWNRAAEGGAARNRLGQTGKRSGWSYFVLCNTWGFWDVAPDVLEPPLFVKSTALTDVSVSATAPATLTLNNVTPSHGAGSRVSVYGSATRVGVDLRSWRTWALLASFDETSLPFDLMSYWEDTFGGLVAGQRIALEVARRVDGYLPSARLRSAGEVT